MTRGFPLMVALLSVVLASAPVGAETVPPPDYLCKPQRASAPVGAETAPPTNYLCTPQPASARSGAETAATSPDYLCQPQPATFSVGADRATIPQDYLCKPVPATAPAGADTATAPAPAEEQKAENARPADVTQHPKNDTAEAAGPAAPAPPARAPVGAALPTVEDLPHYKFAREVEHLPVTGGNAQSRYLTTVFGMIKSHLRETPELHVDSANKPGVVDFYVDRHGNLVGRKLVSSSGSPNLDRAVMTAVTEAAPYPMPPNGRPLYLKYNFGKKAQLNTDTSATAAPAPIVPSVPPPAPASAETTSTPASTDTTTTPATPKHRFSKVVVADNTLTIGHFASANPDCTSSGKTFVRVSRPPSHGGVTMREGLGFTYFEKMPQCNSTKLQGVTVEYLPERGFTGSDEVELDVISQTGYEVLVTYSVTIK